MKRILALALVCLMIITVLAGCGKKEIKTYEVVEVSYNGTSYSFTYKVDDNTTKTISNFKPNNDDKRVEVGGMNAYVDNEVAGNKILYLDKDTYYALEKATGQN